MVAPPPIESLELTRPAATAVVAGPESWEHAFGPVLATEQTLRHEFVLKNPTDRPIALRGMESRTPCCSSIGPPSATRIPAGGSVTVPVEFRIAPGTGRKRVEFVVATDYGPKATWGLAVEADLYGEIDVGTAAPVTLSPGRSGVVLLDVTCHRLAGEGRGPPESAAVEAPLTATMSVWPDDGVPAVPGLERSSRRIEVGVPGALEPGRKVANVVLRWADGGERRVPITWTVTPTVRVSPEAVTIRAGDPPAARTFLVRADRAIRVLGIEGPALACAPAELTGPRAMQRLEVELAAPAAGASDLKITTDHPDQPAATVSVLVLPPFD